MRAFLILFLALPLGSDARLPVAAPEIGIGLGALLAGWIFSNQPRHLPYVHALSLLCVVTAFIYLLTLHATGPIRTVVVAQDTPEPAAEEVV